MKTTYNSVYSFSEYASLHSYEIGFHLDMSLKTLLILHYFFKILELYKLMSVFAYSINDT